MAKPGAQQRTEGAAPPPAPEMPLHDFDTASDLLEAAARGRSVPALLRALDIATGSGLIEATHPRAVRRAHTAAAAARFAAAYAAVLDRLAARTLDEVSERRLLPLIADAQRRAGTPALALSGGGTLGNYHVGVVRLLLRERLLPAVLSGSSAGSLVAAVAGTRTDAELHELFERQSAELATGAPGDRLDGDAVLHFIERLIPDLTFAEAARHSGRRVAIVVAGETLVEGGLVLDAATTPDVLIRDAVLASCAVPFVFAPVALRCRDADGNVTPFRAGTRWIDGSVFADLPLAVLEDVHGADRVIASMVNPMVLPFRTDPDEHGDALHAAMNLGVRAMRQWVAWSTAVTLPFVAQVPAMRLLLETWQRIASQRYHADIVVAPRQRWHDPTTLLANVAAPALDTYIREGEIAARQRLDAIRAAVAIERALARFGGAREAR